MLLWFNNITGSWVMSWEGVFLRLRWTSLEHDDDHGWLRASDASASPTLASQWASKFDSTVTDLRFVSQIYMSVPIGSWGSYDPVITLNQL